MKPGRTFYGWEDGGKFYVAPWPRGHQAQRGANVYATKDEAIKDAVTDRIDKRHGAPQIVWEEK
jgi:hypothetical protein